MRRGVLALGFGKMPNMPKLTKKDKVTYDAEVMRLVAAAVFYVFSAFYITRCPVAR